MAEALARHGQLLDRVRDLIQRGNGLEAELLAHLGEVDARQLYLEEGCFAGVHRIRPRQSLDLDEKPLRWRHHIALSSP